jgi:hypothetical protein
MSDDLSRTVFSDLGRALGIEGLAPEADGSCRLVFDGNRLVEMNAAPAQRRLLVSCRLAQSPGGGAEALRLLLRGNYLGAGAGGGWFSLGPQDRLYLHSAFALADASGALLLHAIERLLDHADTWERRLREGEAQDQASLARMANFMNRI